MVGGCELRLVAVRVADVVDRDVVDLYDLLGRPDDQASRDVSVRRHIVRGDVDSAQHTVWRVPDSTRQIL